MNIETARAIPLSKILETIGFSPVKSAGADIWYHSPLHEDKTPSFHIHTAKNVWYDFGLGKGGGVIDFVCRYLECHGEDSTVADTLRWLRNMFSLGDPIPRIETPAEKQEPVLTLIKVSDIQNPGLIHYLASRGISLNLAKLYLKEVRVKNAKTGRYFTALGFLNDSDGYEIRNPFFKGSMAPKDITIIRGTKPLHNDVHLFEGFMDYLSALAAHQVYRLSADAIILNSLALLNRAIPYIEDYSYRKVHTWFDNNKAGIVATEALEDLARTEGLTTKRMNDVYAPHDDVNAWHKHKLGL